MVVNFFLFLVPFRSFEYLEHDRAWGQVVHADMAPFDAFQPYAPKRVCHKQRYQSGADIGGIHCDVMQVPTFSVVAAKYST